MDIYVYISQLRQVKLIDFFYKKPRAKKKIENNYKQMMT